MTLQDDWAVSMNEARAHYVRWLRVDQRNTWSAVGRECADQWGMPWEPVVQPVVGRAICEAAAEQLGEDPDKDPWN